MFNSLQNIPATEAELLGDLTPLLEQIGSLDGLAALAGTPDPLARGVIRNTDDLRSFLAEYHTKILQPLELPAIQRAFLHASRNEARELIAFDQSLSSDLTLKSFATASRLVGLVQLQRLRPLRDQRVVQRYLASVEQSAANGWHTLVFGVTLAVYYLPLRQGLIGYAQRTTRGFIHSAAHSLKLSRVDADALGDELCARVPAIIEPLLSTVVS